MKKINQDGFRHNAVYLLFIPGFILTSFTHNIFHAIVLGAPSVLDWAIIHTKIGLAKKTPGRDLEKAESQKNKLSKKKVFKDILYAQCWEDPQIDRAAFKINSDDVIFSITSGGCNALAFLIDNPKKLIALDINPQQNFLLDLKISAFKKLSYEELLEFLGVKESNNRLHLYSRIRPLLQMNSASYWDGNMKKIEKGIIHSGRYEGYMRLLKKAILTLTAFILLSMGSVAFGSDLGEIKEITIRVGNFGTMWVLEYTFDFRNYRKVHGEGNQEARMELDNLDQNNPKFGVSIESIGFTSPKSIKTAEVLIYRQRRQSRFNS